MTIDPRMPPDLLLVLARREGWTQAETQTHLRFLIRLRQALGLQ